MMKTILLFTLLSFACFGMSGSKYAPDSWSEVQGSKVAFNSQGVTSNCAANSSTNIDLVLADDVIIRGIEFLASGQLLGDTVTIQIIDTGGVTGAPPGTVIATVVSNYNVASDLSKVISYESAVPKKALATMTIRAIYTSTSLIAPVKAAINYIMLKPLL